MFYYIIKFINDGVVREGRGSWRRKVSCIKCFLFLCIFWKIIIVVVVVIVMKGEVVILVTIY